MLKKGFALPLVILVLWSLQCRDVSQPSEEDLKIIKQHILTQVPEMKYKVNANLEGKVIYLGLNVDTDTIQPGKPFKLSHYWQVRESVGGWQIFVHLNGPSQDRFINADHIPVEGRYPATHWKPGEIIRDEHSVTLPADWAFPELWVYTGLWMGDTRMKVTGPQDEEDRIIAATIPVKTVPPPKPKQLVAWHTKEPISVDGKLKEKIWGNIPSTGAFVDSYSGSPSSFKTEAKICWDQNFLYIAFDNQDEDVWGDMKKRDDKLWTQEAVEIFIDANADLKDYVEIQANPLGTIFDSYLPSRRQNQDDFNGKLQVAVSADGTINKREDRDKGWIVEFAVPWNDVKGRGSGPKQLPPRAGDIWRINMFRMEIPKGQQQQGLAWSPPMTGDFHILDKFGELVFADEHGGINSSPSEKSKIDAQPKLVEPATTPTK